ncbi:MAG: sugar-binding domain-containing protein [Saccharofermentanales bacterium]
MDKSVNNNYKLLLDIAELYYNGNYTQSEIAQRFSISRPKVSRSLAEAREQGIVKIFIDNKVESVNSIENHIMDRFNLHAVKVVSVPDYDPVLSMQITAQAAANFIVDFFEQGDDIGISWGLTIYSLAKYFPDICLDETRFFQITGSLDSTTIRSRAGEIINIFSQKFNTNSVYTMPCPVMLDNKIIVDILLHDSKIKKLYEMTCNCNKLIINLAPATKDCCLFMANYIDENDLINLNQKGAQGSICNRFIDINGNICDPALNDRTFGIPLSKIKGKEKVISIVSSIKKVPVLLAALNSNLINVLVIDSVSADYLLNLDINN